ncbi:Fic family protein [Pseudoxanthomonas winnipegensis]|uniref:Fic family protein n=1 Tax=Pseudoxanthomonas winnipegensis TaxID=2480810 RepID=A0A4Q8LTK1_9GAMM|nr:Fic family protein [Pseudoxanthomonas winnipegensis]RZZ88154.1 Fic family protein [Pseudoxanthomonas winnipegensis]TAA34438.1 Fic family protein [Pseudoxanthomonas winnipegensis]
MARKSSLDPDKLIALIAGSPEGLGMEALEAAFPATPRRNLQRLAATLVAQGRLQASGGGRARRYRVAADAAPTLQRTLADDSGIPLTSEAASVRTQVHRPLTQRTPVGYQADFLSQYQPNQTAYLTPQIRTHLHQMGRSPVEDRPAGTYARQIFDRLLIDLSWSSSRLEGNTYSRLDTQNLIQFGLAATGKDQLEAQMILNHKAAIEMLVEQAQEIGFNRYTLQNLHALLSENLLPDPVAGGRLRQTEVAISGSVYVPLSVPQLIEEHFDTLLAKAAAIADPFEQAFFVMVQLPYLQPFDDVNKRTSRLAANIPLIRGNLAPLSFVDVPESLYLDGTLGVYELNEVALLRDVFVWAYERSCQRYTVLRDALPAPDPLRLKHREVVRTLIAELIDGGVRRTDVGRIRARVEALVDAEDIDDVLALTINELNQLHEGNIARYRIRPSQFRSWQALHAGSK